MNLRLAASALGAFLCTLLAVVASAVFVGMLALPLRVVPDDAIEGVVIGEVHPVPLTDPAVWSQVHVRRHLFTNDDGGSNELLWQLEQGPTSVSLQTASGVVAIHPGDPMHVWRLHPRVSGSYDRFDQLPPLARAGRQPVPGGDALTVRVYALHPGDKLLVEQENGETTRLTIGGREAAEAELAWQHEAKPVVLAVSGAVAGLMWLGALVLAVAAGLARRS